jgi:hypothetical protein
MSDKETKVRRYGVPERVMLATDASDLCRAMPHDTIVVRATAYDALATEKAGLAHELEGTQEAMHINGQKYRDEFKARLKAEADRDRLRAALEILAAYPLEDFGKENKPNASPIFGANSWQLNVGHVKAARAALAPANTKE